MGFQHPRRIGNAAARRPDRARQRSARQQDHADQEQEDHEDVHAEALHEPVRALVQRLARDAAVRLQERRGPRCALLLRRFGELTPSVPAASARVIDADRQIAPVRSGRSAGHTGRSSIAPPATDQRDRREHPRSADSPAEADREAVTDAAAVPVPPQDEAHEDAEGEEGEADTSRWRWSSSGKCVGRPKVGQAEPASAPPPGGCTAVRPGARASAGSSPRAPARGSFTGPSSVPGRACGY